MKVKMATIAIKKITDQYTIVLKQAEPFVVFFLRTLGVGTAAGGANGPAEYDWQTDKGAQNSQQRDPQHD
jgi:hypothetical protein